MSAVIHHFVVHQFVLNAQQELTLVPKSACFEVSPQIEELARQLNQGFNSKPGKGVGGFTEEAEQADFHALLRDMLQNADNFLDFSLKSCDLLKKSLVEMGTVETGFVIFSHYEFLATQYLMISLLNTKQHVEINERLELAYSDHLDLARMQLAVRIDLTELDINPEQQRYISFIKGRMGRKVSDFFMHFLGCREQMDVKQQNKQLVSSVDAYLAAEQLDPEEKQQTREQVTEYYKEKLEQGEDIQLKELADKLPKDNTQDFYQFSQHCEQPLEAQFQPDPGVLRSLAKFSGQGGGISLSFERKLYGERVTYDPHSDTLTIKGLPPNLKDQLLKGEGS